MDWLPFYQRFFASEPDARAFVEACEAQSPPGNIAKLVMHQTQRLVSLAEEIPKIRPRRESLQIFLLVVCAEAVAKLHAGPASSIGSRAAVRDFFTSQIPAPLRSRLANSFTSTAAVPHRPLTIEEVANILYDVRCDVAHEGVYWMFSLSPNGMPFHTTKPTIMTRATVSQLVDAVTNGAIEIAKRHL